MAKKKRRRGPGTLSYYFREIFAERPDLLKGKSNKELIDRYLADHPNTSEKALGKVRANLANIKSVLRRKGRGRKPAAAGAVSTRPGRPDLETLEEHIDEGLILAKSLDRAGLDKVIHHLRLARNHVVWKIGQ